MCWSDACENEGGTLSRSSVLASLAPAASLASLARFAHASLAPGRRLRHLPYAFFHMRRTNTWHFLQQSGQFLRLSGQARSEPEGGPTASKIDHFVEGNATCWSDMKMRGLIPP